MDTIESLVEQLSQQQWVCSSSYVPSDLTQELYEEAKSLYTDGCTKTAHIGQDQNQQKQSSIRNTQIYWFEPELLSPVQAKFWRHVDELRQQPNEACFLNLCDFECHYTIYPPGAFYQRHLDQFRNDNRRQLSFLLYLNPHWQAEDGGMLRIYAPASHSDSVDISPNIGNFVMFRSDRLEHEVLPTQRTRYGVVGWMRNRPSHQHLFKF